jgi:hypothetical protein
VIEQEACDGGDDAHAIGTGKREDEALHRVVLCGKSSQPDGSCTASSNYAIEYLILCVSAERIQPPCPTPTST